MTYLFLFLLFIVIELLYFKIADRYNIIDKPNHRSSHTQITIRGGGILFPIAMLFAFVLGYATWPITLAVVLVAAVSFVDDIKPLSQLPRFISHTIAIGLIFYDLNLFTQLIWILPIVFVLMIGWVNAFNFMDGINGITVLYAVSAITSFAMLPTHKSNLSLLIVMGLSCLVFGFFNVRTKAKTFAGDVGSISLALFLGYFMINTIIKSQQYGYILFFAVYGIDAVITIIYRIRKKENILEAHRSHLYQYLANERKYSHLVIAFFYGFIQLLINIALIYLDSKNILTLPVSFSIFLVLVVFYLIIRARVEKSIKSLN